MNCLHCHSYVFSNISESVNCLVCLTLCNAMNFSLPGSSVHDSPGKNTGVGCHTLLQEICLPNQGIKPTSPTLQVDSLASEPPGKPTVILWLCKGESESHSVVSNPLRLNPMDCSLPGSSVHGILQARILEWVAVPFSRGSSQPRDQTQVSRIAGGFFIV